MSEPVAIVINTDVLPGIDGMYRHDVLSEIRLPNQAELFIHNDPLVAELEAMKTYIDDVCTVLCGPYRWCNDTIVLRKIEQLLKDGNKLLGNK